MGYQLATLVWLLLIASVIISGIATIASLCTGFEEEEWVLVGFGIAGIFLTIVIGWGIWVIYPMTALAMG